MQHILVKDKISKFIILTFLFLSATTKLRLVSLGLAILNKSIDTGKKIGDGHILVIAEIGNNHNGSYDNAIKMINLAHEAGADCVKFQIRHIEEVYRQRSLNSKGEDLGTEYVLDLLKRFELSTQEHLELFNYCKNLNIEYLCTPWDQSSVKTLESFGVPAFKVASADLTNMPLLDTLTKTGKPLILSTGMSTEEEVQHTADFLNLQNAEFVLLHCNSTYPAPLHDINLNWMKSIQKIHPLVGYSGHERGINVALASIALNACVVERHFTVDRNMEGPDHAASLTFEEFKLMIDGIREIETALGTDVSRHLSQGEMINRENLGKSIVASSSLKKGKIISSADLMIKSPGQGISPQFYNSLIGLTLARDMKKEERNSISIIADLTIGKGPFKATYKSDVRFDKNTNTIKVTNIEGPLKYLHNKCSFQSKVILVLVNLQLLII